MKGWGHHLTFVSHNFGKTRTDTSIKDVILSIQVLNNFVWDRFNLAEKGGKENGDIVPREDFKIKSIPFLSTLDIEVRMLFIWGKELAHTLHFNLILMAPCQFVNDDILR